MAENGCAMIGLVRWILRVTKKEHALFTNYRRAHRHFLAYLGLDALLSASLIATGMHFFGPEAWAAHESFMLEHPGVIPEPVDKFLDYVTRERETAFWLGAATGDLYAFEPSISGKEIVSYYGQSSGAVSGGSPTITVTTFKNALVYQENSHLILGEKTKAQLSNGATVEFDAASLKSEVVTFKEDPSIVSIEYPEAQTVKQLLTDAANLKRLD